MAIELIGVFQPALLRQLVADFRREASCLGGAFAQRGNAQHKPGDILVIGHCPHTGISQQCRIVDTIWAISWFAHSRNYALAGGARFVR
jgi:hypothetical protein